MCARTTLEKGERKESLTVDSVLKSYQKGIGINRFGASSLSVCMAKTFARG